MKPVALIVAVAALTAATPAHGQYVFLDVNGDGVSSQTDGALPPDRLDPSVTSVDVYFVTDKNRDGSNAVCSNSSDPFSIVSYEFTLHSWGSGTVTFGTWTDNLGFGAGLVPCGDGTVCPEKGDAWIAKGGTLALSPGKHHVGTLAITVTGTPVLDIAAGSLFFLRAATTFGSSCLGTNFDNTIRLGADFTDVDGTEPSGSSVASVWGKIRSLYR